MMQKQLASSTNRTLGTRTTNARAARAVAALAALAWIAVALRMSPAPRDGALAPAVAHAIEREVNTVRAQDGLAPLAPNPALVDVASDYARLLGDTGTFDHTGPDASTLVTRAEAHGYVHWSALAENLATGEGVPDAGAVMEAWMLSPTHRSNLLAPGVREAAAACYVTRADLHRYWCVLELARP